MCLERHTSGHCGGTTCCGGTLALRENLPPRHLPRHWRQSPVAHGLYGRRLCSGAGTFARAANRVLTPRARGMSGGWGSPAAELCAEENHTERFKSTAAARLSIGAPHIGILQKCGESHRCDTLRQVLLQSHKSCITCITLRGQRPLCKQLMSHSACPPKVLASWGTPVRIRRQI